MRRAWRADPGWPSRSSSSPNKSILQSSKHLSYNLLPTPGMFEMLRGLSQAHGAGRCPEAAGLDTCVPVCDPTVKLLPILEQRMKQACRVP